MRIRAKLTILLLTVSLTPLILMKIADTRSLARMSDRVVERVTDTVSRRVQQELLGHVRRSAEQVGETRTRAMLLTRAQAAMFAESIDRATAAGDATTSREGILTTEAFEAGTAPGLREQTGWGVGVAAPMVSYSAPVFVPAPGLSLDDPVALASAKAMLARVGLLDALTADSRAEIRSQYICLANGLHMSFPGKKGYPEGFDGRDRPWYRAAAESGGPSWTGPDRDAPTGELRLSCSAPVLARDGTILGVTGVDLSLKRGVALLEPPSELALGSRSALVAFGSEAGIEVLGIEREDPARIGTWRFLDSLHPEDRAGFERVVRELGAGRDGVAMMPRESEPSVWAYASIAPGLAVVMIVPRHRVASLIEPVRLDLRGLEQESFRTTAVALAAMVVVSLLAAYGLARTISRPIRRMADAAEAIALGDLSARVRIRPRADEVGKLARLFNTMVPALADRMRLRESVELATELQQGLLPRGAPSIPGLDVHGVSVYCDETGGDYFDYLTPTSLGPGRYGLVIGDVTGHGIPSALVMTSARSLLRSHAGGSIAAGELLGMVNEAIAGDSSHGRFITLTLVVFDTSSGTMRAANAGHDPGMIYRAGSGVFDELPLGGLPLGIVPGETYETAEIPEMEPGDVLLLGTDGIWELRDPGGRFYGKERLREILRRHAAHPAQKIGEALMADLETFRGSAPRQDDVTYIIAKATD